MMAFVNGNLVEKSYSAVSLLDKGFLIGDGLFETMRVYNSHIFALEQHLDRLFEAADVIELENLPEKSYLENACRKVVSINALVDARVRLTVTRGLMGQNKPTVVVVAEEYNGYEGSKYETGMFAIIVAGYRFSSDPFAQIKSTSYQRLAVARNKAIQASCDEALLINEQGSVCEGSFTNLFAVYGQDIATPPLSDGLLPGIARMFIMRIARENGFNLVERTIKLNELFDADEIFLTNSLVEVMPLTAIDGSPIGNGKPGRITSSLHNHYRSEVEHRVGLSATSMSDS